MLRGKRGRRGNRHHGRGNRNQAQHRNNNQHQSKKNTANRQSPMLEKKEIEEIENRLATSLEYNPQSHHYTELIKHLRIEPTNKGNPLVVNISFKPDYQELPNEERQFVKNKISQRCKKFFTNNKQYKFKLELASDEGCRADESFTEEIVSAYLNNELCKNLQNYRLDPDVENQEIQLSAYYDSPPSITIMRKLSLLLYNDELKEALGFTPEKEGFTQAQQFENKDYYHQMNEYHMQKLSALFTQSRETDHGLGFEFYSIHEDNLADTRRLSKSLCSPVLEEQTDDDEPNKEKCFLSIHNLTNAFVSIQHNEQLPFRKRQQLKDLCSRIRSLQNICKASLKSTHELLDRLQLLSTKWQAFKNAHDKIKSILSGELTGNPLSTIEQEALFGQIVLDDMVSSPSSGENEESRSANSISSNGLREPENENPSNLEKARESFPNNQFTQLGEWLIPSRKDLNGSAASRCGILAELNALLSQVNQALEQEKTLAAERKASTTSQVTFPAEKGSASTSELSIQSTAAFFQPDRTTVETKKEAAEKRKRQEARAEKKALKTREANCGDEQLDEPPSSTSVAKGEMVKHAHEALFVLGGDNENPVKAFKLETTEHLYMVSKLPKEFSNFQTIIDRGRGRSRTSLGKPGIKTYEEGYCLVKGSSKERLLCIGYPFDIGNGKRGRLFLPNPSGKLSHDEAVDLINKPKLAASKVKAERQSLHVSRFKDKNDDEDIKTADKKERSKSSLRLMR